MGIGGYWLKRKKKASGKTVSYLYKRNAVLRCERRVPVCCFSIWSVIAIELIFSISGQWCQLQQGVKEPLWQASLLALRHVLDLLPIRNTLLCIQGYFFNFFMCFSLIKDKMRSFFLFNHKPAPIDRWGVRVSTWIQGAARTAPLSQTQNKHETISPETPTL